MRCVRRARGGVRLIDGFLRRLAAHRAGPGAAALMRGLWNEIAREVEKKKKRRKEQEMLIRWRQAPGALMAALFAAPVIADDNAQVPSALSAPSEDGKAAALKALGVTGREAKILATLSEEQLKALAAGANAGDVIRLAPTDLGDLNNDLVYVPVTPCR